MAYNNLHLNEYYLKVKNYGDMENRAGENPVNACRRYWIDDFFDSHELKLNKICLYHTKMLVYKLIFIVTEYMPIIILNRPCIHKTTNRTICHRNNYINKQCLMILKH